MQDFEVFVFFLAIELLVRVSVVLLSELETNKDWFSSVSV
ncbi:13324_t:CDS:2 [Acaulospora colombiana]|uniref:13324_t:CDS:1 n=1 Tax=Acaulospora colombiana TaxID=27376 RepID=A0ACA9KQL6_9GLOM|nr:13324_t:CDS:2 [Acaulospora colombiana]